MHHAWAPDDPRQIFPITYAEQSAASSYNTKRLDPIQLLDFGDAHGTISVCKAHCDFYFIRIGIRIRIELNSNWACNRRASTCVVTQLSGIFKAFNYRYLDLSRKYRGFLELPASASFLTSRHDMARHGAARQIRWNLKMGILFILWRCQWQVRWQDRFVWHRSAFFVIMQELRVDNSVRVVPLRLFDLYYHAVRTTETELRHARGRAGTRYANKRIRHLNETNFEFPYINRFKSK